MDAGEFERRIVGYLGGYWDEFKEPVPWRDLNRLYAGRAARLGLSIMDVLEGLQASGRIHVLMLASGKRFAYPGTVWDAMSDSERLGARPRLERLHASAAGRRNQSPPASPQLRAVPDAPEPPRADSPQSGGFFTRRRLGLDD